MSLIPSESASFPDLLGRGLDASKKSKWRLPAIEDIAPPADAPPPAAPVEPASPPSAFDSGNGWVENAPSAFPPPMEQPKATFPPVAANPVEEFVPQSVPVVPTTELTSIRPAEDAFFETPEPAAANPVEEFVCPLDPFGPSAGLSSIRPAADNPVEEFVRPSVPIVPSAGLAAIRPPEGAFFATSEPAVYFEAVDSPSLPATGREPVSAAAPVAPQLPAAPAPETVSPLYFQPAASPDEPEEFGFPEADISGPSLQRRRRNRLIRFVLFELVAIAFLVCFALIGLSHRSSDDLLSIVTKILTIASAIAVAGVPILFYGLPETLPRNHR